MSSSYLEASFVLGDMSLRDFALKSLDRLLELNHTQADGMYHFYDGQSRLPSQLVDQVYTARAMCDAYEATGSRKFLTVSEKLLEVATRKLFDSEHGGFFDTVVDSSAPGFLSKPAKPLDENSVAAHVLTRLYHLTGKEEYRKQAEDTLKRFVEIYPQFGFMAADYAMSVDAFLHEPSTIHIVGSPEKPQTKGLLSEAHRIYEPRRVIHILDPVEDRDRVNALGYKITETPTAYVCIGKACTAPIIEPKEIAPELSRMINVQFRR